MDVTPLQVLLLARSNTGAIRKDMDQSFPAIPLLLVALLAAGRVTPGEAFCWEPGTSPFTGPPKVVRFGSVDEDGINLTKARVDWASTFTENSPSCQQVDFLVMTYPKNNPSAYTLSDFTPKGKRTASMVLDQPEGDFVFQVVAREDKGPRHGIDYKYSDMVVSYAGNGAGHRKGDNKQDDDEVEVEREVDPEETAVPSSSSSAASTAYADSDPWYIYECVPFLKQLEGFPDTAKEATPGVVVDNDGPKHNQALVDFVRHSNRSPLNVVRDFLDTKKTTRRGGGGSPASCDGAPSPAVGMGYVVRPPCAASGNSLCCSTPWLGNPLTRNCSSGEPRSKPEESLPADQCYEDFVECDGGKCVPKGWRDDGWPDCLDGSDETNLQDQALPQQLLCVQCAGVVLSAGFICRESDSLTDECVRHIMGSGGSCNPCVNLYLNLP